MTVWNRPKADVQRSRSKASNFLKVKPMAYQTTDESMSPALAFVAVPVQSDSRNDFFVAAVGDVPELAEEVAVRAGHGSLP